MACNTGHSCGCDKKGTETSDINLTFLLQQFREGEYSDCFIQSGVGDSGKIFQCHKIFLTAFSPYFKRKLADQHKNGIYMSSIDEKTLEKLINYMYSGGDIILTDENIFSIYTGAEKLELKCLIAECTTFMRKSINDGKVIQILKVALKSNDVNNREDWINSCVRYFFENIPKIGKSELDFETLYAIIKREGGSAKARLDLVVEWLNTIEVSSEVEKSAYDLIKEIRLKDIPVAVLHRIFQDHQFLQKIWTVFGLYVEALEEAIEGKSMDVDHSNSVAGVAMVGCSKRLKLSSPVVENQIFEECTEINAPPVKIYFLGWLFQDLYSLDLVTKTQTRIYSSRICTPLQSWEAVTLIYHHGEVCALPHLHPNGSPENGKNIRMFDVKRRSSRSYLIRNGVEKLMEWFHRPDLYNIIGGGPCFAKNEWRPSQRFNLLGEECYEYRLVPEIDRYPRQQENGLGILNRCVYAVGGYSAQADNDNTELQCYNPDKREWELKAPMPNGRVGLAVAILRSKLYALGGRKIYQGEKLNSVDIYDAETNSWTSGVPMNKSRANFSANVWNNCIYVFGGDVDMAIPTYEKFSPVDDKWYYLGQLPPQGHYESVTFAHENTK